MMNFLFFVVEENKSYAWSYVNAVYVTTNVLAYVCHAYRAAPLKESTHPPRPLHPHNARACLVHPLGADPQLPVVCTPPAIYNSLHSAMKRPNHVFVEFIITYSFLRQRGAG